MKFTHYFWWYRVLSAYILLLVSTIFATDSSIEADHVQSYEERHEETMENNVGFGLLLFAWIATPVWHYIGAMIVFDYGNLESISRDVHQLAEDNKWLDVWELIKFGAEFRAHTVLLYLLKADKTELEKSGVDSEEIESLCLETLKESKFNFQFVFIAAIRDGEHEMIDYLLKHQETTKIDINKPDILGKPPIFHATRFKTVRYFIEELQCDCNVFDKEGHSLLYHLLRGQRTHYFQDEDIIILGLQRRIQRSIVADIEAAARSDSARPCQKVVD